jgi:phenylacetic acid degradation operon negative regulatory protein
VLGEFVLARDDAVWTQVLIDVLGRLGVEPKSARQALARTAAEGLLESDRAGRRVRWSLTAQGRGLLTDGAARIYGFGAPVRPWAGRWLVLLVSVPEVRRQLRHRLRTGWPGPARLPRPGVWLSPDPDKQDEVARVLADLELTTVSSSFVGPFGTIGAERDLVAQAWDLAEVEQAYEGFLRTFSEAATGPTSDILSNQIHLVHAWRRFPSWTPSCPPSCCPSGGREPARPPCSTSCTPAGPTRPSRSGTSWWSRPTRTDASAHGERPGPLVAGRSSYASAGTRKSTSSVGTVAAVRPGRSGTPSRGSCAR